MIVGLIDEVREALVTGWVMDANNPAPQEVQLLINGRLSQTQVASIHRPGLVANGAHPTGACGYEFLLNGDERLSDGDVVEVVGSDKPLRRSPWRYVHHAGSRVFFMHIAKTAGSSLNDYLGSHFPRDKTRFHCENSARTEYPALFSRHDCISGHIRFAAVERYLSDEFLKITVLRDPFEHIASHLSWLRHLAEQRHTRFFAAHPENIQRLCGQLEATDMGDATQLERFLSQEDASCRNLFDNCQTRYFLPLEETGWLDADADQRAWKVLRRFDVVGSLGAYPRFVQALSEAMNWPSPPAPRKLNVQPKRFGLDLDDPSIRAVLENHSAMDQRLYDSLMTRHQGLMRAARIKGDPR